MSLRINLEPGGIIWQARRHMATTPGSEPLGKDADGFEWYAWEMASARRKRDALSSEETAKFLDNLIAESVFNSIGRQLTKQQDLPSGKRLKTYPTLLNESLGIMPDYPLAEPNVKKIGRVTILLHALTRHTHYAPGVDPFYPGVAGGMDILTDGTVNMSYFSLVTCGGCLRTDLTDESRLLDRFGLETLYRDQKQLEIADKFGKRTCAIANRRFTNDQVAALQSYLHEQFSPDQE